MQQISLSIGDLFTVLGIKDIKFDESQTVNEDVFIRIPGGDYAKINSFIRKESPAIKITTKSGRSFVAAENHIVIEKDQQVFLKNAESIACERDREFIVYDDIIDKTHEGIKELFDVSIDEPHLYCDSSGVIHHNTTVTLALCKEIGADVLFMNCSKDNSVTDVRTKIFNFATSMSLTGNHRVFLGDEFDYISKDGQAALRGVIEQTVNSCRYIFTCNFLSKIIDPLKSRLQLVDFKVQPEHKAELATQFMNRCMMILETEKVQFNKKALAFLIQRHYPDFRKVIQELQRAYNANGKIDESVMAVSSGEVSEYIKALKAKDFKAARKWIAETYTSPEDFFKSMYRHIYDVFAQDSIAQAILTLNTYQIKHVTAIDPELNLSALTVELMSQCNFK